MGEKQIFKYLIAGCLLFTSSFCLKYEKNSRDVSYAYSTDAWQGKNEIRGASEITISNSNLKARIYTLLGKNSGDKLYADDFMKSEIYNSTNADIQSKTYLDLSYGNMTNILELAYFEFPESLVAIDLSGNNITNENLTNLSKFISLTKGDKFEFGGQEITSKSDFSTVIKKINLCYNDIDLSTLTSNDLDNEIYLFGIQKMPLEISTLMPKKDLENAKYYIRSSDNIYLSYNFYIDQIEGETGSGRVNYTQNAITTLFGGRCGDYKIVVSNPPLSTSGYFYGLNNTITFTLFDVSIKDEYIIERNSLIDLKIDTQKYPDPNDLDIEIEGLILHDCQFSFIEEPKTDKTGISYINLKLKYKNAEKVLSLPFQVVDTTPPVITLKGYEKMYWKQNKAWVDPGYTGIDNGEDISLMVSKNEPNVTECGTYIITYSLTDLSGNKAENKTRTVIVQEQLLDEIVITSDKDKYSSGDEVILTVQPASGTPISNYKDFKYSWYMDGVLFKTSNGDATTGKSTISLILDKGNESKITVKLTAKQKIDDAEIHVDSQSFEIKTNINLSDNSSILIASAIAVAVILIVIIASLYIKSHKSKKKIHEKKSKPAQNRGDSNIQVIKDFNDKSNKDDK